MLYDFVKWAIGSIIGAFLFAILVTVLITRGCVC